MLKKFLGLALLLLTAGLYLYGVPFINKNTVTCVDGKSSGSFINELAFYDNDGYYVTLNDKEKVYNFIKNLDCKKVYSEEINGIINYYLYTDKLPKKQVIKGKKVNIHLSINGDTVTLGYPFIYGSY